MIVAEIRTHRLQVPFAEPPKTGFLDLHDIDLLVVEVETRDGVVGTGHLHPLAGGMRTLETCVREMLAPLVVGADCSDPAAVWERMRLATFIQGRMGITTMAMSAIDVALWDAVGRTKGVPLWRLWGGRGDPIPAYGSGCYRGLGREGMIEKARRFADQGYDAIKMQVAHVFSHDEDVANVAAMRDAMGDGVRIMVDVNQGWTPEEAAAVGPRLDPYGLEWLEEPVMADDFAGYARVADAVRTPLATGENNWGPRDLEPFFERRMAATLQPDVMRGGYTELFEVARRAEAAGLSIAPHLFPELMSHLMASIPNGTWLEWMGWFDHLWVEPMVPAGGRVAPPDRPGHGMDFRPELFGEFRARD